ncbi:hypothetical protein SEVIR_4G048350v4 [Setaria viridis]
MKDLPEPSGNKDKSKAKEDEDDGDNGKFQNPSNTINIIFGSTPDTATKRSQKLALREIMSIELATPTFLKWFEVPITFSRKDHWTSLSEPEQYPLVLDPIVTGSRLTKVLIDGGSDLNVLFAKTLRKMGLDITDMLTSTNSPFYGVVPGNATVPLDQVVLPATFGTKEHYQTKYIRFEVTDFETSYHAILGKPALAKFMTILHYVDLVLKMSGPKGVLSLRGDLIFWSCDLPRLQI